MRLYYTDGQGSQYLSEVLFWYRMKLSSKMAAPLIELRFRGQDKHAMKKCQNGVYGYNVKSCHLVVYSCPASFIFISENVSFFDCAV